MNDKYKYLGEVHSVDLEAIKFEASMDIDHAIINNSRFDISPYIGGSLAFSMKTEIYGTQLNEYRYPKDWWQAVKERFAPKIFLQRYPVEYNTIDAYALYPQLEIPPEHYSPVVYFKEGIDVKPMVEE